MFHAAKNTQPVRVLRADLGTSENARASSNKRWRALLNSWFLKMPACTKLGEYEECKANEVVFRKEIKLGQESQVDGVPWCQTAWATRFFGAGQT